MSTHISRALIIGCVLALQAACSLSPGVSKSTVGPQPEIASYSAREAYPLAERVAREWQSDAELRSVRATWQNASPAELREGKNSWAFYFVSPSSKTGAKLLGYIVSVYEGKAEAVKAGDVTVNGKSLTFVDWKVDSPQALKRLLENGGQDFLARHTQVDVHAILQGSDGGPQPVWEVTLLDKQTKDALSLRLDAATGEVKR